MKIHAMHTESAYGDRVFSLCGLPFSLKWDHEYLKADGWLLVEVYDSKTEVTCGNCLRSINAKEHLDD